MRYSNQFTIEEAKKIALNPENITDDATLYMQGENWGSEDNVGTMEDWEESIPETDDEARATGWYDWFVSDENYDDWNDYRDLLISQLRPVEIVEGENEDQHHRV